MRINTMLRMKDISYGLRTNRSCTSIWKRIIGVKGVQSSTVRKIIDKGKTFKIVFELCLQAPLRCKKLKSKTASLEED